MPSPALGPIGAALGFGGGILGAVGQLKAGNEALRNAKIQAQVIGFNLEVSQVQTRQRVMDINRQFNALSGRQIVVSGKSGVEAGSGSSLLVNVELRREQRLQILRENFEQDTRNIIAPFQASQIVRAGKSARDNSRFAALGSVLGGSSQAIGALNR